MATQAKTYGGIDRSYDLSFYPKLAFAVGHVVIVICCVWVFEKVELSDPLRAEISTIFAIVYCARHVYTLYGLLRRRVGWDESIGLLFVLALFEIGLVLVCGGFFDSLKIEFGITDWASFILYSMGSLLNSVSEQQRKWFKDDVKNQGKLFTGGLFKYSMHINYFGDAMLFTGWCLLGASHFAPVMFFPALITIGFVYFHIPSLDQYLQDRYGRQRFDAYAKKTNRFFPWQQAY